MLRGLRQVAASLKFLYAVTLDRSGEAEWIPFPKHGRRKLAEVLNRDQLPAPLRALRSPKYHAVFLTCYAAGLRIGEACRLRPEDIDPVRRVIRVRRGRGCN